MGDNIRLEILKENTIVELELKGSGSIKYNKLVNKISSINSREISHSNTFSLLVSNKNIQALELNVFNKSDLAASLNKKREANYYINNKLVQRGFLIINNVLDGSINVNFIDKALGLIDDWSALTYKEFLQSDTIDFPTDFETAINEMKDYLMPKNAVLPFLSEVGSRGYNLALYPNNLNTIGEKWQLDTNENRPIDSFNPYQNRPIFNTKAFLDIVCESFGYTTDFETSIVIPDLEKTYITPTDTLKNEGAGESIETTSSEIVGPIVPYYYNEDDPGPPASYEVWNVFDFGSSNPRSRSPSDIPVWTNTGQPFKTGYETRNCLYLPKVENSTDGYVNLSGNYTGTAGTYEYYLRLVWYNTAGTDVVFQSVQSGTLSGNSFNLNVLKTVFDTPPAGTGEPIGFLLALGTTFTQESDAMSLSNMVVEEESLISGGITYDKFGQYVQDEVNLTHAAPNLSIKKLISSVMGKFGLLLDIDFKNKVVNFFTYKSYLNKRDAGEFEDWSEFLVNENSLNFNTNYGNEYGVYNKIGLKDPYLGNVFTKLLQNQGSDSKYKAVAENYNKVFADVSNVNEVENTDIFLEFTATNTAMVEYGGEDHLTLNQVRADGSVIGNITGVPKIVNVNYASLDNGVNEWYNVIDNEVRLNQLFLLPSEVFLTFDIKKPIYLRQKSGYYIVEEIKEYTGYSEPVQISLIKLSDNINI